MQPNVANTGIYSHPHRSGSFRRSHLKCWTSQKDAHIRLDLSFGDGILFSLGNEKKCTSDYDKPLLVRHPTIKLWHRHLWPSALDNVHYNDTQTSSLSAFVATPTNKPTTERKSRKKVHLINYLMRLLCRSRRYQRFRSIAQHMCPHRILMHLERYIMREIDHFCCCYLDLLLQHKK